MELLTRKDWVDLLGLAFVLVAFLCADDVFWPFNLAEDWASHVSGSRNVDLLCFVPK
jgi:hypothetical protein